MELSSRKKEILKAIIKEYIITAEPIGSRTISKKYILDVGSATIRNEMADLEEMGLIRQPHTSAGRIPSDKGYRFYVDTLMDIQEVPKGLSRKIKETYMAQKQEMQEIIQITSRVLSDLTKYTALVASPKVRENEFQSLQLIPIEGQRVLVVVVTGSGTVHHKMVNVKHSISRKKLDEVSRLINDRLQGLALGSINEDVFGEVEKALENRTMYRSLFEAVQVALSGGMEQAWDKIYLGGTTNILDQPEFSDLEKVKLVMKLFEHEDILKDLLDAIPPSSLNVIIGEENSLQEIRDCSLVTADYSYKGQVLGKIAILGPTRMEYSRVVSMVRFMAEVLSKVLHEEE